MHGINACNEVLLSIEDLTGTESTVTNMQPLRFVICKLELSNMKSPSKCILFRVGTIHASR